MPKDVILTPEGLEKLKEELAHLSGERRRDLRRNLDPRERDAIHAGARGLEPGEHDGRLSEPGVWPFNAECGRTSL